MPSCRGPGSIRSRGTAGGSRPTARSWRCQSGRGSPDAGQVARAVGHRVEVVVHLHVAREIPGVRRVHHRAPPNLAPQTDRPVVGAGRLVVGLERFHGARAVRERDSRRKERLERSVEHDRVVDEGRIGREVPERSAAETRLVEEARARVQDHLAGAGEIPREPEPRLRLRRFDLAEPFRHAGVSLQHHAVCGIARPGHEGADVDLIHRLARRAIEADPRSVDRRRVVEPRRLARVVSRRIEVRHLVVGPVVRRVPAGNALRSRTSCDR